MLACGKVAVWRMHTASDSQFRLELYKVHSQFIWLDELSCVDSLITIAHFS